MSDEYADGDHRGNEQVKTWLTTEGVQALRNAALSSEVATYLQDRNLALFQLLADTGLRRDELAQIGL